MMRGWALLLLVACSDTHKPAPKPQSPASSDPWHASSGSSLSTPLWTRDPKVLRDTVVGVNAHVIVLRNLPGFPEYRKVLERVEHRPGVVAAEPFWFAELEIDRGGPALGIAVKGLDPQRAPNVLTIGQHMVRGKFDLLREQTQSPAILLGDVLADKLAARLGDVVTLSVPGASKKVSFQVAGMFHYDFEEYDDRLAIVALPSMQRLLDSGDDVMGVDMRLDDIAKSATVAKELGKELGDPYQVMDWYELHKHTITAVFGDWKP